MATIRDDAYLMVTQDGVNYKIKKSELQTIFSAEALEKIDELESRPNYIPTLQEVLSQGQVTNKDIVLSNGENDAIDISPTENRIIIASVDDSLMPRISLVHAGSQENQSRADIELEENGRTLDFDMEGAVEEIRFRFGNDEKFVINKVGDAEFIGKVKASDANEPEELTTLSQVDAKFSDVFTKSESDDRFIKSHTSTENGYQESHIFLQPDSFNDTYAFFLLGIPDGVNEVGQTKYKSVLRADGDGMLTRDTPIEDYDNEIVNKGYVDSAISLAAGEEIYEFEWDPTVENGDKMTSADELGDDGFYDGKIVAVASSKTEVSVFQIAHKDINGKTMRMPYFSIGGNLTFKLLMLTDDTPNDYFSQSADRVYPDGKEQKLLFEVKQVVRAKSVKIVPGALPEPMFHPVNDVLLTSFVNLHDNTTNTEFWSQKRKIFIKFL